MNSTTNQKGTLAERLRGSVSLKLSVIIVLSLLMLIPTIFIRDLIRERQFRRDDTIREVTSKWGEQQEIFGPLIILPYLKKELGHDNTYRHYKYYMHILPDELSINGSLYPDIKRRGIYDVTIYTADLSFSGKFEARTFHDLPGQPEKILWDEAILVTGFSDLHGLDTIGANLWNDQPVKASGGVPYSSSVKNGVHARIKLSPDSSNSFSMQVKLKGSESIRFVPAGGTTNVNLRSEWPDPSFMGATLPTHETGPEGFSASWSSMALNRPFPQVWTGNDYHNEISNSAYGVDLIIPVDIYQKSERSVKYALLFIGLTFLVIFFIEVISKQRIHPVQYLLTGAALIIFYSLLLALSEHLPFPVSYLIASVATVGLITGYAGSIFTSKRYVITTAVVLTVLYGFLYTILQISDLALLVGNIGLFIAIAMVMYFSRKINWYREPDQVS